MFLGSPVFMMWGITLILVSSVAAQVTANEPVRFHLLANEPLMISVQNNSDLNYLLSFFNLQEVHCSESYGMLFHS